MTYLVRLFVIQKLKIVSLLAGLGSSRYGRPPGAHVGPGVLNLSRRNRSGESSWYGCPGRKLGPRMEQPIRPKPFPELVHLRRLWGRLPAGVVGDLWAIRWIHFPQFPFGEKVLLFLPLRFVAPVSTYARFPQVMIPNMLGLICGKGAHVRRRISIIRFLFRLFGRLFRLPFLAVFCAVAGGLVESVYMRRRMFKRRFLEEFLRRLVELSLFRRFPGYDRRSRHIIGNHISLAMHILRDRASNMSRVTRNRILIRRLPRNILLLKLGDFTLNFVAWNEATCPGRMILRPDDVARGHGVGDVEPLVGRRIGTIER